VIGKAGKRLRKYWYRLTHKKSHFFGFLFEVLNKQYRTSGLRFEIPNNLISRSFKTRFFFDTYEIEERKYLDKFLDPDDKVLELGGCIGVVSCFVNRILNHSQGHVVVEANPNLIPWLNKNRELNHCSFEVENCVISDQKMNEFYLHDLIVGGSPYRHTSEKIQVQGKTIDEIEASYETRFDTLIMDIEGGELNFLRNNTDFISRIEKVFVEIHGFLPVQDRQECRDILKAHSFEKRITERGFELWQKV